MATREPPVELYYDPADLDPEAPRLYIGKNGSGWELRDEEGALLSAHAILPEALDAAGERSKVRFSEIIVRGASSSIEWSVSRNPEMVEFARVLNASPLLEREAGVARRRVDVGAFWGHHVFLPVRRRRKEAGDGRAIAAPRPVERVYDPSDLEPGAPRLHIGKDGGMWDLRDDDGRRLSRHRRLPQAMDAALARSNACFSEILVRTADGNLEWSLRHNLDWTELARALNRRNGAEREAAD
jgi:hypothetical protein